MDQLFQNEFHSIFTEDYGKIENSKILIDYATSTMNGVITSTRNFIKVANNKTKQIKKNFS